jgi:hypothetical protein
MDPAERWLVLLAAMFAALIALLFYPALVRAHDHPKQDEAIHQKFYNTWMMPDSPTVSCCHDRDCYPTEARKIGNRWEAKRREDGQWLVVPPEKIETQRDNPDGRNHLCAPPPHYGDRVYCFIVGGGT